MKKEDLTTLSSERKFEEQPMAPNISALNVWQASSRAPFSCLTLKGCDQGDVSVLFSFSAQARHPKEGFFTPWVKRLAASIISLKKKKGA